MTRENIQLASQVSIHAPTWSATSERNSPTTLSRFQSTRPRGARLNNIVQTTLQISFNPRAHVERDISQRLRTIKGRSFNPRAHVERDRARRLQVERSGVSIHAPTWSATNKTTKKRSTTLFQSTRPRGARQANVFQNADDPMFQSTRPRGARRAPHCRRQR